MSRIRIVRFLPVLDFGGVESRTVTLGKCINRDRFDYRVCALSKAGNAGSVLREIGIEVDELEQETNPRSVKSYSAFNAYIKQTQPHIVHSSISDANIRAAWARLTGSYFRLILEEVGVDPFRSFRARAVHGLAARVADLVIGVSRQTCEFLIERHGVPREKIVFVNNSMDSRFIEIPPRVHSGKLKCLAVGRLVPEKNHGMLIDAFNILKNKVQILKRRMGRQQKFIL